jgi:cytochrome c553
MLIAAAGAVAADVESARQKAQERCIACHGEQGVSPNEGVPSLAAQPDQFVQWQLVFFRSGNRKNEAMQPFIDGITDVDIRNLGAYYAGLAPPKPPDESDDRPELTAEGKALAEKHRCASCHLDDYRGQQANARLAAQREDYLLKALREFKSGARAGGGIGAMPQATYPLSDGDMQALSHYLARLP